MPLPDGTPWAPHDTLLGQVQRGRGLGAQRAVAATGRRQVYSARAVYGCVTSDPRWDILSDDRALYLARLVVDLALPADPIGVHLAAGSASSWHDELPIETLGCLARLGREDAIPVLRHHATEGATWQAAFEQLSICGGAALDGLDEVLLERAADDDLDRLVGFPTDDAEPWPTWLARHPRIAAASRRKQEARDHRRQRRDFGTVPRDALVAMIRRPRSRYAGRAATELGRRGDPVLLDLVEELCQTTPRPAGLTRAVRALGQSALSRARDWMARETPYADVALWVVAEHGRPTLVAALERTLSTEDWCVAHQLPEAVARLEIRDAVPALRAIWVRSPHDHLRGKSLPALMTLDPAGTAPLLGEALWDSSDAVRGFAAARVPLTPYHRRRLVRLRDESPEEPEVRAAAAHRLER